VKKLYKYIQIMAREMKIRRCSKKED